MTDARRLVPPRLWEGVLRGLHALRRRLAEDDAPETHLRPEDVRVEAHQLVRQHGIGVAYRFVDVRPAAAIAASGTLPDALRRGVDDVVRGWRDLVDDIVVLVDQGDGTATAGALRLRAAGHDHAWAMAGGFDAWRRAGGEIEPA